MKYSYKQGKPVYKHIWFWVLAVFLALVVFFGLFVEEVPSDPQPTEAVTATVEPTATPEPTPDPTPTPTPEPTPRPTVKPTTAPAPVATLAPTPVPTPEQVGPMVWVSRTGKRYHNDPDCSGMNNPSQIPLSEAEARGLTPCGTCCG